MANDIYNGPVPDRVMDERGIAGMDAANVAAGMNTGLPLTPEGVPDPEQSMEAMFHDWLRNKLPELAEIFMQEMKGRMGAQNTQIPTTNPRGMGTPPFAMDTAIPGIPGAAGGTPRGMPVGPRAGLVGSAPF